MTVGLNRSRPQIHCILQHAGRILRVVRFPTTVLKIQTGLTEYFQDLPQ
jgi:hypothetical protein